MTNIKLFANPTGVATAFAKDFADWVAVFPGSRSRISVALSGGSTPQLLYQLWAAEYADQIAWNRIHFFWGDERCVPPENEESNYGVAARLFLDKISIEPANIHRMRGEDDPETERVRYELEICEHFGIESGVVPVFDLIILGMGHDGHTASIFPEEMRLMHSDQICAVAIHPVSKQQRITMTGRVLNAAKQVAFLITGANKAEILVDVINKTGAAEKYPAAFIQPEIVDFYLDQSAARLLAD